jgi:hypothetical protein
VLPKPELLHHHRSSPTMPQAAPTNATLPPLLGAHPCRLHTRHPEVCAPVPGAPKTTAPSRPPPHPPPQGLPTATLSDRRKRSWWRHHRALMMSVLSPVMWTVSRCPPTAHHARRSQAASPPPHRRTRSTLSSSLRTPNQSMRRKGERDMSRFHSIGWNYCCFYYWK